MKKPLKTISKAKFVGLISKKLGNQIHNAHVANVISLFIDEFVTELRAKERIDVPNFCSFRLERTKPRKFHNIHKKRFAISAGKTLLKIKLSRALRDKIVQNLDLVKTFI